MALVKKRLLLERTELILPVRLLPVPGTLRPFLWFWCPEMFLICFLFAQSVRCLLEKKNEERVVWPYLASFQRVAYWWRHNCRNCRTSIWAKGGPCDSWANYGRAWSGSEGPYAKPSKTQGPTSTRLFLRLSRGNQARAASKVNILTVKFSNSEKSSFNWRSWTFSELKLLNGKACCGPKPCERGRSRERSANTDTPWSG